MTKTINLAKSEFPAVWKAIRELQRATPLNHASIGRNGLRVHSGGMITIENGGLRVTGSAEIIGSLIASGTIEFSGQVTITGPLDISGLTQIMGDLQVLTGGKITAGSITLNPDGSANFGTMTIDPTGKITSGLFVLNPDGSAKFGDMLIGADGTITTGDTVIDTTGRAEFGTFIIDPASNKLIQAPGGWMFSDGPDHLGLSSSVSSSVNLNSGYAELNHVATYLRVEAGKATASAQLHVLGNLYSEATSTFRGAILHPAITGSTQPANMYVDANGRYWRGTSASRYKLEQQVMPLPESLLDPVMKDWIDSGSQARYDALNNEPRPFRENDQLEYDSINLRRVPGMVAEEVAAAGGEAFVTYDSDGQVEGFAYDRFALARTQVLVEQLAAERERNDLLEKRLAALEA